MSQLLRNALTSLGFILSLARFGDRQGSPRLLSNHHDACTVYVKSGEGRLGNQLFRLISGMGIAMRLGCDCHITGDTYMHGFTAKGCPVKQAPAGSVVINEHTAFDARFDFDKMKQYTTIEIHGYLQMHEFWYPYRDKILENVQFSDTTKKACTAAIMDKCHYATPVTAHVRGGDYISSLGLLPNASFYINALNSVPAYSCILIVTDSVKWVQHRIVPFITNNVHVMSTTPAVDMCILSRGSQIFASSTTFSYLGVVFATPSAKVLIDRSQLRRDIGMTDEDARRYWPPDWTVDASTRPAPTRVAIIVPYRVDKARVNHIRAFIHHMNTYRREHPSVDIVIYLVEQKPGRLFNRGMMINVGIRAALEHRPPFKCIVTHDMDRMPMGDVPYGICNRPTHILDWLPYGGYVGGVFSASPAHWKLLNGMSNRFWGWGAEDDELAQRIRVSGLGVYRPPTTCRSGGYTTRTCEGCTGVYCFEHYEGNHTRDTSNRGENNKLLGVASGQKDMTWTTTDGISTLSNAYTQQISII